MTQGKDNVGFVTIALPKDIIDDIDKFVDKNKPLYNSRPHVVKVALEQFFKNNGGEDSGGSLG